MLQQLTKGGWQRLINLLCYRSRKRDRAAPTPFVSFRIDGMIRAVTVVWVLDRELRERGQYWVYRN